MMNINLSMIAIISISIIGLTGCGNDYKWDTDNTSPLEGKYETRNIALDLSEEKQILAVKSKAQNFFYSNSVAGLSVSIIFDGNRSVDFTYGCAKLRDDVVQSGFLNYEEGPYANCEEKLTSQHRFKIGSLSKTVVGRTILDIDDNPAYDFDINDPIIEHLPKEIVELGGLGKLTVKNLLHHTSGLARIDLQPRSATEMIAESLSKKRAFKVGQMYQYNNLNFVILGQIIEEVTGSEHWQFEVQKRVDEAIGSDNSFIFPEANNSNWIETPATEWLVDKEGTLLEGNRSLATGYEYNATAPLFTSYTGISGADIGDASGSGIANTIDMGRWFKGVATNDSKLLTAEYFKENIEQINTESYQDIYLGNPTWNTGAGLFFEQNQNVLWHLGNFPGYACSSIYSKNEKVTITTCTNQSAIVTNLNFDLLSSMYPYRKEFLPKTTTRH